MAFMIFVVALALAQGLQLVQTRDLPSLITLQTTNSNGDLVQIQTFPGAYVPPSLAPQPLPVEPEQETEAVEPELRPEPVPDVEAVVPELMPINPCDACFDYMTALIEQLTEVAVPEIEPHPMPEVGVPPVPNPPGIGSGGVGPRPLGPLIL